MFFGGYTHISMMESIYAVANSIAGVAGIENTTGETIPTVPGTDIQLDQGKSMMLFCVPRNRTVRLFWNI